jgi:Tfp pilus assembly protein PilZ
MGRIRSCALVTDTERSEIVRPGVVAAEAAETVEAIGPALRKMRALPVRFGAGPALFSAMTVNLSESGMFVNTLAPVDPGIAVRILVDVDIGALGLNGKVVWSRRRVVMGRPVGMGVQLITPPQGYVDFVREIG